MTRRGTLLGVLVATVMIAVSLSADDRPQATPKKKPAAKTAKRELSSDQQGIAARYQRFEKKLLQLAEFLRRSDPDRAELLTRAYGRSRDDGITQQLERITSLLGGNRQLGDALERQGSVVAELQALLYLLQSDDVKDSLRKERERLTKILQEVRKRIGEEKRARTGTERGDDTRRLERRQADVARKTKDLVKKIDRQDEARRGEDGQDKDGKDKDGKDKDGKDKDGKGKDGKGKGKDGKGKDGKGKDGKGKDGKGKDGKGKDGQDQDDQARDEKTPGRDEIEAAHRAMERAIEELKKQNREGAAEEQDQALEELIKAKEKLEEILRQLREEEQKLLLAALEARFQKMLAMQLQVFNFTIKLGQVDEKNWVSRHTARSIKIARDEEEIAVEAVKALILLKEEGSSVAFPEAVVELREDMLTVARRLERSKVRRLTQVIEKDIIEALEEMIEALQKELEKSDEESPPPPPQQQQQQQQQDPPLVDQLAELKMLRALQLRVNRRTRRLGRLIDGEQAKDPDVVQQLRELARRQARIQKAARDIATGRNR